MASANFEMVPKWGASALFLTICSKINVAPSFRSLWSKDFRETFNTRTVFIIEVSQGHEVRERSTKCGKRHQFLPSPVGQWNFGVRCLGYSSVISIGKMDQYFSGRSNGAERITNCE